VAARKRPSIAGKPADPALSRSGVQTPISSADGSGPSPVPEPRRKRARREPNITPPPITLAPFLVSLDWLCLNMSAPVSRAGLPLPWECLEPRRWWDEIDPDRVYMTEPTDVRTRAFDRVTYVNDENRRKVLTIWSQPHDTRKHGADWIQVQPANHTFATGEWATLVRMLTAIGCNVRGISRVDIACDGLEGEGGEFPAVIETCRHAHAKYYGKCDWIVRSQRGKVIGGEFGHRASNKFVRAYRKCREMKSKGIKPHIVKQWETALGFDPMERGREVNRFEVQLKGKEIRRYFPQESGPGALGFVLDLTDPRKRADLFASMAPGMFDFRWRAKRARDAMPVAVWDWSRVVPVGPNIANRAPRNLAVSDHTIKTGLRAMFHLAVVTSEPSALALAERQAAAAGPHYVAWFDRKRVQWTREFGRLCAAGDTRTLEFFRALETEKPPPELQTREQWEQREQWELLSGELAAAGADIPREHPTDEPDPDPDAVDPW